MVILAHQVLIKTRSQFSPVCRVGRLPHHHWGGAWGRQRTGCLIFSFLLASFLSVILNVLISSLIIVNYRFPHHHQGRAWGWQRAGGWMISFFRLHTICYLNLRDGWRYQNGWIFGQKSKRPLTKSLFTINPILVEFWERSTAWKEQRPFRIIIIVITIIITDVIIFKVLVFWSFLISLSLFNKGCAQVCGFCESHQNMIITSASSTPQQHINPRQTRDLSKNLHDRISGAKILHTKSA